MGLDEQTQEDLKAIFEKAFSRSNVELISEASFLTEGSNLIELHQMIEKLEKEKRKIVNQLTELEQDMGKLKRENAEIKKDNQILQ